MSPVVRQLIVGASRSDAITNMALRNSAELHGKIKSEIFAFHPVSDDLKEEVRNIRDLTDGETEDVFVYHSSYGIPEITRLVQRRSDRVVMIYHNITPSDRYWDYDPGFASALEWGRYELSMVRENISIAIADSEYNANELRQLGYQDVRVIPAGVNPHRLAATRIDPKFNGELSKHFPDGFVLFVSQVIPHKRAELAMEVVHLLRSVHRLNVGLVIAGPCRNTRYRNVLDDFRARLPEAHVLFTGEVSEQMLATLYRRASVLLGTSDHEGLGIPPLEAMAEGCPVVIRGCGAVPETVATGGIVLHPDASVLEITELVASVVQSQALRTELVKRGHERVRQIDQTVVGTPFSAVIQELIA